MLHSKQYRTRYAADLKRMLPRIPLAASTADFEAFAEAGRRLCDLHVGYENVEPYPLHEPTHPLDVDEWDLYRVTKMRWKGKTTKRDLVYNSTSPCLTSPSKRTSTCSGRAPAWNGSSTDTG